MEALGSLVSWGGGKPGPDGVGAVAVAGSGGVEGVGVAVDGAAALLGEEEAAETGF